MLSCLIFIIIFVLIDREQILFAKKTTMSDFKFYKIPNTNNWVVLDPKRASRPHIHKGKETVCPFCPENIQKERSEVYRIGGNDHDTKWDILVINNKFPFAPVHELVLHTRQHKGFSDLTLDEFKLAIGAYVNRYNAHKNKGGVVIFVNSGHDAGESISHAHAQVVVVPEKVDISVPKLEEDLSCYGECLTIGEFILMCPPYSQWPDEVWIVPKERKKYFGEVRYEEIESLAFILKRLIHIFTLSHQGNFPFNYYIYPYKDWYIRIISRAKVPGGFEIATGTFVNTQDPAETVQFIKNHFYETDENIAKAEYRKGV